jgi:hypothetical protein
MGFLAGVSIWVIGLFAMLGLSGWVLGPLEQRAKRGQHRIQFTLGDWICLILMIQLWTAVVHSFTSVAGQIGGSVLVMDIYGWVLVVVLWLGVVLRLSAAGIRKAWHRGVALVVIYPLNVLGAIIAPSLLVAAVFSQVAFQEDRAPPIVPLACAAVLALLLGAMAVSAHFVKRIVAALDSESAERNVAQATPVSSQQSQSQEATDPE